MSEEQLQHTVAVPAVGKAPATVQITWTRDHIFEGVRQSGGPSIPLESSCKAGPSPVVSPPLPVAGVHRCCRG